MPVANHTPSPKPEEASKPAASNIPKPALGANYHEEQTLSGMPVPDAGLIPEEDPEPAKAAPETRPKPTKAKPANKPSQELDFVLEAEPEPEPEPESDPFIETTRMGSSDPKPASAATPEPEDSPKPGSGEMINADPTLSTMSVVDKESAPAPEQQVETAKTPAQKTTPEVESNSDSDNTDPYLETMRIPTVKKDEFDKTIPGLQDPPKSIH
jgi:hypothetical protein